MRPLVALRPGGRPNIEGLGCLCTPHRAAPIARWASRGGRQMGAARRRRGLWRFASFGSDEKISAF